jgi:hypothetical protein
MADFKKGDKVSWESSQGTVEGEVVRKVTSDTSIEEHKVKASEDEPQFEVKSDKTGAHAFHKPDALKKR